MLDARTALLLEKINSLCAENTYKIADREELLGAFSPALAPSSEGLDEMLSCLQENGYIDIRYADKSRGVYCLQSLPAGKVYSENAAASRAEAAEKFRKTLVASFFASFVAAFAGASLGAGMVAVLTALIG